MASTIGGCQNKGSMCSHFIPLLSKSVQSSPCKFVLSCYCGEDQRCYAIVFSYIIVSLTYSTRPCDKGLYITQYNFESGVLKSEVNNQIQDLEQSHLDIFDYSTQ